MSASVPVNPLPDELARLLERHRAGDYAGAEAGYRAFVAIHPDDVDAAHLLGLVTFHQRQYAEAEGWLRRAIELNQADPEPWFNLSIVLEMLGRWDEALASCEAAIQRDPQRPDVRLNRAMLWLMQGDFARGWPEYEWRWHCGNGPLERRSWSVPEWDGGPLAGRTILLHAEQGFGDTVQFVRYAALAQAAGGRVVLECPPVLQTLLARLPYVSEVVTRGAPLPAFDVQAALLSLPRILKTDLNLIPAAVPYLTADPRRAEFWRGVLGAECRLKIAICWQGNPQHPRDRQRSLPLSALRPLVELPHVRCYSVQRGFGREQLAQLRPGSVVDLSERLTTFDDTAAVLMAVDLLVSCDSAVVHLAGALARPTWVLLSAASDFRWLLDRADSPWYPTARLFRQPRTDAWGDVVQKVVDALPISTSGVNRPS